MRTSACVLLYPYIGQSNKNYFQSYLPLIHDLKTWRWTGSSMKLKGSRFSVHIHSSYLLISTSKLLRSLRVTAGPNEIPQKMKPLTILFRHSSDGCTGLLFLTTTLRFEKANGCGLALETCLPHFRFPSQLLMKPILT